MTLPGFTAGVSARGASVPYNRVRTHEFGAPNGEVVPAFVPGGIEYCFSELETGATICCYCNPVFYRPGVCYCRTIYPPRPGGSITLST